MVNILSGFDVRQGTRQGDPLSLFLICAEILFSLGQEHSWYKNP